MAELFRGRMASMPSLSTNEQPKNEKGDYKWQI